MLHVITGLGTGGAERQLLRVSERLVAAGARLVVVSLGGRGTVGEPLERAGVAVHALGARANLRAALLPLRLARLIRRERPAVVHAWMWHANALASVSDALAGTGAALAWNVRASIDGFAEMGVATSAVVRLGARLSRRPRAIVFNSRVAAAQHEAIGYDSRRTRVIPNGFDCEEYAPRPHAGARLRAELGLAPDALLVGHFARFHPMKDHAGLLRAFRRVAERVPTAHLVAAGTNVAPSNPFLAAALRDRTIAGRVHLLGERADVPALMAGVDVAVSSSACLEGFPNVVGEAMASGTPCAVTDVGDAAWLVGDTGPVVPPRDPGALATALVALLQEDVEARVARGRRARARVLAEFSIARVAAEYRELYEDLAAGRCA